MTSRLHRTLWIAALLLMAAAARLAAQPAADAAPSASLRLFEQEPYDLLRFKDGKEVKVQLLTLKTRRLPERPRAADKIVVRTLDEPDVEYEVTWGDIDVPKSRLFEQLILEEAEQLVAAGRFNDAYDYYAHLQYFYAKLPGLEESLQNYLFEEAKHYQRLGQFDHSLALLNELHRRNPQRPELSQALGAATGKLVEQKLTKNDYPSARKLVRSLQQKFPQNAAAAAWVEQLSAKAREGLAQAQADLAAGKYREAADASRQSMHIWPLEESRRLLTEAHEKFPRVVVGVTLPGGAYGADPMIDWAARRSARLFNRRLLEFTGYGPQGGEYQCPLGELERPDLGKRMLFRLRPDIPWSDGKGVLTGIDVSRKLLQMADPSHPAFRADWAELFRTVSAGGVYEVDVELRRAHVHPDGLLQTILTPWDAAAETAGRSGSIGPYVVDAASGDEVRYLANQLYFATSNTQPREIVERYFAEQRQAVQALKTGELAVLDRIVPWEVEALAASGDIVVERYAVPTIHCLIPNTEQPFLARRAFRRALAYAINRDDVLHTQMLRGAPASLGQVISGPFPRGENPEDPVGYAYNEEVAPHAYDPIQSLVLVNLTRQQLALRYQDNKQPADAKVSEADLPPVPKLVLAHPPHDIARVACRAIQKQLAVVHIPIELLELQPGTPANAPGEWDLLYAELNLWEPVIDARRLLGPRGLAGNCSPYMDLQLRQLSQAEDWKRVREKLLNVHRQAHEDLAIIPLWQLIDHFAYHKSLQGVGKRPAMLYQHIESWRAPPWFSAEAL
jgi:ABC-type transport system substrate-binding protein